MSGAADGLALAAAAWVIVSLAVLVLSAAIAAARPLLRAGRREDGPLAPVSVVIPVKLLDEGFARAQASVLRALPSGSEIIVTAREDASPALTAAREIFADCRHPVRILRSTRSSAASPKIDNLVEAVDAAAHDLIVMKDSNVELPDGVGPALAALREGVGLVCAIPRAIEATTFAAQIEAQVMNQSHGRLLMMADALGLGFGVGKIMVFRRSVVAQVGGLAAVGHSVGEDSALADALARQRLRTAFMRPLVTQRLGARRWRDVYERQMRWTAVRASNTRLAFAIEPLGLCVVAAAAAAVAAPLAGLSAPVGALGCLALWFVVETALALRQGWDVSLTAPAVMVARDSLMLFVWLRAPFTRRVMWAGNKMPISVAESVPDIMPCPPARADREGPRA